MERWGPGEGGRRRRKKMKEDLAERTGRKQRRLGRIDYRNGEEGAEGKTRNSKRGRNGRENFEREGSGPSLSATDGHVDMGRSLQGGRSMSNGVVTGYRGDDGRYVV